MTTDVNFLLDIKERSRAKMH